MSHLPIADYAMVSDCHTAGLISRYGSIDWLPFPRFDSPSVFCRLLDDEGGHFNICPTRVGEIRRTYLEEAICLRTVFQNDEAEIVLEDMLSVGANDTGHELGANAPHAIIGRLRCINGEADIAIEYAPRPEYGLISPVLRKTEEGIIAQGGAAVLFLTSPVTFEIEQFTGRANFRMQSGNEYFFVLEYRSTSESRSEAWPLEKIRRYFEGTLHAWRTWSEMHQNYQGPYKKLRTIRGYCLPWRLPKRS